MLIISAIVPYLQNWLTALLIDGILQNLSSKTYLDAQILILILLYAFFLFLFGSVDILSNTFSRLINYKVAYYFQMFFVESVSKLDREYFENPKTQEQVDRALRYGNTPQNMLLNGLDAFSSLVAVIVGLWVVYRLNPFLIIIVSFAVIPNILLDIYYINQTYKNDKENSTNWRDYHKTRNYLRWEDFISEAKISGAITPLVDRMYFYYNLAFNSYIKIATKWDLSRIVGTLIGTVSFFLILYLLVNDVISGVISIGLFTFYLSSLRQLGGSIQSFFKRVSRMYEHTFYMADILTVVNYPPLIISGDIEYVYNGVSPRIEIKDVSFVYPGTKKKVLSNINLNISQGEHIAFVGENGAGKTTIIKLLLRFYDPTKGEILLDGVNIKNYTQESLYKAFGVLFQDYNFYHFTVKENIGYGNFENMEDFNSITSMAKKAGAHDFIMNYEYQYEQRMNKSFDKGITPSVGQKQRIAIARAFFRNAPILILDEPTSAIDPKAEYEIFEEILKFSKGKTVIIISHRFSTVRNADRILVLDKGKIIEEGSHEQLMLIKDGKYKHAFNLQKKGYE